MSVLAVSMTVMIAVCVFTNSSYRNKLERESIDSLQAYTRNYAASLSKALSEASAMVAVMSNSVEEMIASQDVNRKHTADVLRNVTLKARECKSFWALLEPDAFGDQDVDFINDAETCSNGAGRFAPSFYTSHTGQVLYSPIEENMIRELAEFHPRIDKPTFCGPGIYPYENGKSPAKIVSIVYPITRNGKYLGSLGADLSVRPLERSFRVLESTMYAGTYMQIISYNGKVAYHSDSTMMDKPINLDRTGLNAAEIIAGIRSGREMVFEAKTDGKNYFHVFCPIVISRVDAPLSVYVSVPESSLMAEANKIVRFSSLLIIPGIALLLVVVIMTINVLIRPINGANRVLTQLSLGHISKVEQLSVRSNDEVGKMSQALNALTAGLRNMLNFAENIGKRNYAAEYRMLSEQDELGAEMIEMRDNLAESAEKEALFKKEEERRNWVMTGVARFAELLRANNDNIEELCNSIVSNMVKYIEANQAGIFILNDDDAQNPVLEMKACYAYERRKYMQKTLRVDEGLVGACFLERQSIYMTELPKDYIRITSGLGDDTPRALLLAPLKVNEDIYGIVEIAAFKEFEPHVRDFVEKIAESIASTVASVKVNIRTNKLLEISKMQSEEMAGQEEELRQNMEEMQATQEEMARKQAESEALQLRLNSENADLTEKLQRIEQAVPAFVLSDDLRIEDASDSLLAQLSCSAAEVKGRRIDDFVTAVGDDIETVLKEKVLEGETASGKITFANGQEAGFCASPLQGNEPGDDRILFVCVCL